MKLRTWFVIAGTACCAACDKPSPSAPINSEPERSAVESRSLPDMSLFGGIITLGQPLDLPDCNDPMPTKPCIQAWRDESSKSIFIPALASSDRYRMVVRVDEVDGAVHVAQIESLAESGADTAMLEDFVAKFGKPSNSSQGWAEWHLNGLHGRWLGSSFEVPHGTVIIATPAGDALRASQAQQYEDTRLKP